VGQGRPHHACKHAWCAKIKYPYDFRVNPLKRLHPWTALSLVKTDTRANVLYSIFYQQFNNDFMHNLTNLTMRVVPLLEDTMHFLPDLVHISNILRAVVAFVGLLALVCVVLYVIARCVTYRRTDAFKNYGVSWLFEEYEAIEPLEDLSPFQHSNKPEPARVQHQPIPEVEVQSVVAVENTGHWEETPMPIALQQGVRCDLDGLEHEIPLVRTAPQPPVPMTVEHIRELTPYMCPKSTTLGQ